MTIHAIEVDVDSIRWFDEIGIDDAPQVRGKSRDDIAALDRLNLHGAYLVFRNLGYRVEGANCEIVDVRWASEMEVAKYDAGGNGLTDGRSGQHLARTVVSGLY